MKSRTRLIALTISILVSLAAALEFKSWLYKRECFHQLRSLGIAFRIYADDHNGALPSSFAGMSNEVNNPWLLFCPADPKRTPFAEKSSIPWDSPKFTYQLLQPGRLLDQVTNQPIIRCPIHDLEVLGDDTVQKNPTK